MSEAQEKPEKRVDLDELVESLRRQRDELHLQLHLAKAEARDEWGRLETRWGEIEAKLKQARGVAGETASELGVAAGLMADELQRGYAKLRKLL